MNTFIATTNTIQKPRIKLSNPVVPILLNVNTLATVDSITVNGMPSEVPDFKGLGSMVKSYL